MIVNYREIASECSHGFRSVTLFNVHLLVFKKVLSYISMNVGAASLGIPSEEESRCRVVKKD